MTIVFFRKRDTAAVVILELAQQQFLPLWLLKQLPADGRQGLALAGGTQNAVVAACQQLLKPPGCNHNTEKSVLSFSRSRPKLLKLIRQQLMKVFRDKVAVITGAASGIGQALASRCAQEGMKIVLADIEETALARTEQDLRAAGATVLAVRTDVSQADDVEALAQQTLSAFGAVHLLGNNAGVSSANTVWESSLTDWQWVLGVNLWGVIHGVRTFVPLMLQQSSEGHIVNTASILGLISYPAFGIYQVTKHGVVTLSETLAYELASINAPIKVSVLCPAGVNTQILNSGRNRPAELQNTTHQPSVSPAVDESSETLRQLIETGMAPLQVAEQVFDAIKKERFYILPHPEWKPFVQKRMEDIMQDRNPC
jgi:NAD(P)-dependent dehydrogenase (short-subunit alcohol dehydrogenase family)